MGSPRRHGLGHRHRWLRRSPEGTSWLWRSGARSVAIRQVINGRAAKAPSCPGWMWDEGLPAARSTGHERPDPPPDRTGGAGASGHHDEDPHLAGDEFTRYPGRARAPGPTSCLSQLRAFGSRMPPLAGAAGQLLHHVLAQVVFHLTLFEKHQPAPMGEQNCLDQLRVHPGRAIPISLLEFMGTTMTVLD